MLVPFLHFVQLAHLQVFNLSAAIFISIFCCLCSWLLVIVRLRIMFKSRILQSIGCLLLLHDYCVLLLIVISQLFLIFNFILLPLCLSFIFTLLIRIEDVLALRSFLIVILRSLCWDLVFLCIIISLSKLAV